MSRKMQVRIEIQSHLEVMTRIYVNGVRNVWGEKNLNSASPVVVSKNRERHQVEYVFQGLGFFFIIQNGGVLLVYATRKGSMASNSH